MTEEDESTINRLEWEVRQKWKTVDRLRKQIETRDRLIATGKTETAYQKYRGRLFGKQMFAIGMIIGCVFGFIAGLIMN